jgi:hypothetical protein
VELRARSVVVGAIEHERVEVWIDAKGAVHTVSEVDGSAARLVYACRCYLSFEETQGLLDVDAAQE